MYDAQILIIVGALSAVTIITTAALCAAATRAYKEAINIVKSTTIEKSVNLVVEIDKEINSVKSIEKPIVITKEQAMIALRWFNDSCIPNKWDCAEIERDFIFLLNRSLQCE